MEECPRKMDLKIETLRHSWLFIDLKTEALAEIACVSSFRKVLKGSVIFRQGDPPDFLHIIGSGKVKQFKNSSSGKTFTTAINATGDPLNVVALLGAKAHFVTTQAISDAKLLSLTRKDFLSFVERHPVVMRRMLYTMGNIINSGWERLADLAGETASQRVLNVISMLCYKFGDEVPFTRGEVADIAGTTPETTTRVLGKLRAAGIIEPRRGCIDVLDRSRLRDFCKGSYIIHLRDSDDRGLFDQE